MMMIVFTTCLLAQPDHCRERGMTLTDAVSQRGCLLGAQPRLARWIEAHPKWRIARWTCRAASSRDIRI